MQNLGKVQPNSPNERKNLGKFCYHKMQKLRKNPNFGVRSVIQKSKIRGLSKCLKSEAVWGVLN